MGTYVCFDRHIHIGYETRMNITGTFTPLVRIEETIVPD